MRVDHCSPKFSQTVKYPYRYISFFFCPFLTNLAIFQSVEPSYHHFQIASSPWPHGHVSMPLHRLQLKILTWPDVSLSSFVAD